jgi:hypothetical protein
MTLLDADKDPSVIGEDTWELFEVIEESFGVKLGNYFELAGITVGRLAERIDIQTAYPPSDGCLSSAVFYQLRRAFKSVGDVPDSRSPGHTSEDNSAVEDVLSSLRLLVATETGRGLDEISSETRIPIDLNIY